VGNQEARRRGDESTHKEGGAGHALASNLVLQQQDGHSRGQIHDRGEGEELKGRGAQALHIAIDHIARERYDDSIRESGIKKVT